jgi:uncharacterized protein
MDALLGGLMGILIGSGIFAHFFPVINEKFMDQRVFPAETIPELLGIPEWIVVVVMVVLMTCFLFALEYLGL